MNKFKKKYNSRSEDRSHIFSPTHCTTSSHGRATQRASPLFWSDRPQEGADCGARSFFCLLVPVSSVPATPSACLYGRLTLHKGCTNSGRQVVLATEFCAVSPRRFGVLSMDPGSCYHPCALNFERTPTIFGKIVHLCTLPLLTFV